MNVNISDLKIYNFLFYFKTFSNYQRKLLKYEFLWVISRFYFFLKEHDITILLRLFFLKQGKTYCIFYVLTCSESYIFPVYKSSVNDLMDLLFSFQKLWWLSSFPCPAQFQRRSSSSETPCSSTTGASRSPWTATPSPGSPGCTTAPTSSRTCTPTCSSSRTRTTARRSTAASSSTSPPTSTTATTLWSWRTHWGGTKPPLWGSSWTTHLTPLTPRAWFQVSFSVELIRGGISSWPCLCSHLPHAVLDMDTSESEGFVAPGWTSDEV